MIVDCDGCRMRDLACGECVVSFLLGTTGDRLDDAERQALGVLADSGLVPPLRLVPDRATGSTGSTGAPRRVG